MSRDASRLGRSSCGFAVYISRFPRFMSDSDPMSLIVVAEHREAVSRDAKLPERFSHAGKTPCAVAKIDDRPVRRLGQPAETAVRARLLDDGERECRTLVVPMATRRVVNRDGPRRRIPRRWPSRRRARRQSTGRTAPARKSALAGTVGSPSSSEHHQLPRRARLGVRRQVSIQIQPERVPLPARQPQKPRSRLFEFPRRRTRGYSLLERRKLSPSTVHSLPRSPVVARRVRLRPHSKPRDLIATGR